MESNLQIVIKSVYFRTLKIQWVMGLYYLISLHELLQPGPRQNFTSLTIVTISQSLVMVIVLIKS